MNPEKIKPFCITCYFPRAHAYSTHTQKLQNMCTELQTKLIYLIHKLYCHTSLTFPQINTNCVSSHAYLAFCNFQIKHQNMCGTLHTHLFSGIFPKSNIKHRPSILQTHTHKQRARERQGHVFIFVREVNNVWCRRDKSRYHK